jgi:hypothetical protein
MTPNTLFYKLPRKKVNPVRLGMLLVLESAMLYTPCCGSGSRTQYLQVMSL